MLQKLSTLLIIPLREIPQVKFIITTRKRSCGKVMFLHLSVSHSVPGGSLYDVTSCLAVRSPVPYGKGVSMPGPMFLPGGLLPGGLCPGGLSLGDLCPGGLCYRDSPCTVKSGQYASYWNVFLFQQSIYFGFTF